MTNLTYMKKLTYNKHNTIPAVVSRLIAKISIVICGLIITVSCNVNKQNDPMGSFISGLMGKMTLEEKIGQLNQVSGPTSIVTGAKISEEIRKKIQNGQVGSILNTTRVTNIRELQDIAINESRLKIPLIFGLDVIHGYRTMYPIPLAMSCTWDTTLIEKYARTAAIEASSDGINWVFSPMVDLVRDPRWGRVAESAGEDPYLGSKVAVAMVRGYQGKNLKDENTVLACVKHFALYGAPIAGRDYNSVDMSEIQMYQDYFPPYQAAVNAGAGSIMTSFNDINGTPATVNKWLLSDVLRNQWGFDGLVLTDYTAINEVSNHGLGGLQEVSALALKAGVDIDMVGEGYLTTLKKSLEEGKISEADIDRACKRVLEAKYKLGVFEDPYRYINEERASKEISSPEKVELARDVARRSIVLLKNENQVLPLPKKGTIAVVGPLANSPIDVLGTWALPADRSKVVSILQGIKDAAGQDMKVVYTKGANVTEEPYLLDKLNNGFLNFFKPFYEKTTQSSEKMLNEAIRISEKADVIVAVLGEFFAMSGEAASLTDIGLRDSQKKLLEKMVATGKPVVLVLVNGRPLTLEWEAANVDAILETWAGGSQAGNAIADVLFGDYNPSGKLTMTFPRNVGQIPIYYSHKNTGRPYDVKNTFTSQYLDVPNEPLYPFGFGLSYTNFEYGDIRVNKTELTGEETLTVTTEITNTGKYAGEEIVQLYIQDPVATISRPVKELKGFKKIAINPREKKEVTFSVSTDDLKFYNSNLEYVWEPGEFIIYVGPNSGDTKGIKVVWSK